MPKRPNPFGDVGLQQYKTHVNQKLVDVGRNGNMKVIYEKTKQLLYMGANSNGHASVKQHDEHACKTIGANGVATNGNHFAQHKESHLLGQLTLDSSGYLTHTSPLRTGNSSTVQAQQAVAVVVECHQCKKSSESWSICGFCESKMCLPCSLTCSRCSGLFCNFCSVVNYETSEDRIFCLNCSG